MTIANYLNSLPNEFYENCSHQKNFFNEEQVRWYRKLKEQVAKGQDIFNISDENQRRAMHDYFKQCIHTEELKAWYGSPEGDSLFQGTSISSLTIPYKTKKPLELTGIDMLENKIAEAYIETHDQHEATVRNAIGENVESWMRNGLFYGIVLPSKIISQAFDLSVPAGDVIFDVDGHTVDPHEILACPDEIRAKYFKLCSDAIKCFGDLDITQQEMEESLILADISKPKIKKYQDKLLLAPIRTNEICALMARHIAGLVREKTNGRINPPSLNVTIYDTDTPYTYYQTSGSLGHPLAPVLPGLVVQGTSGTIDAFRWLYSYRVSLVAQKSMKGSLYSQVKSEFIPFMFMGVLVPRDADILLDMHNLDRLRYRGNLSPMIEYSYLIPKLAKTLKMNSEKNISEELESRLK